MGNCQATEAAAVVLQHPGGLVERLYWPTSASVVMRSNPGHYVALITLCLPEETGGHRVTRVRLLRAKDTLVLGQVYRLVTSQEVIKGLRARKQERMRIQEESALKKMQPQEQQQQQSQPQQQQQQMKGEQRGDKEIDMGKMTQAARMEGYRQKTAPAAIRVRHWRPSLQSISEAAS